MPRALASPKFPIEMPHSQYRSNPAADEGQPSRTMLNGVSNLRGLLQHGGNRAVFFFRKPHRVFHGFLRHLAANEVGQMNRRVDSRMATRSFGRCPHFEAGERLAFL